MKTIDSKSLMVFTILFVSIFAMPLVVNAQEKKFGVWRTNIGKNFWNAVSSRHEPLIP
ncbi:MAG: hypothetical protein ACXAES_13530 [Promethearchaeota archaeon]